MDRETFEFALAEVKKAIGQEWSYELLANGYVQIWRPGFGRTIAFNNFEQAACWLDGYRTAWEIKS